MLLVEVVCSFGGRLMVFLMCLVLLMFGFLVRLM